MTRPCLSVPIPRAADLEGPSPSPLRLRPLKGSAQFDFSGGSIGNFFFAGARIFFSSLDAAIFLFSRVSGAREGATRPHGTALAWPDSCA